MQRAPVKDCAGIVPEPAPLGRSVPDDGMVGHSTTNSHDRQPWTRGGSILADSRPGCRQAWYAGAEGAVPKARRSRNAPLPERGDDLPRA